MIGLSFYDVFSIVLKSIWGIYMTLGTLSSSEFEGIIFGLPIWCRKWSLLNFIGNLARNSSTTHSRSKHSLLKKYLYYIHYSYSWRNFKNPNCQISEEWHFDKYVGWQLKFWLGNFVINTDFNRICHKENLWRLIWYSKTVWSFLGVFLISIN